MQSSPRCKEPLHDRLPRMVSFSIKVSKAGNADGETLRAAAAQWG
jgi:hypothetical protein